MVHHISKKEDRHCMIISIDAKEAFDKIQHPCMTKTLINMGISSVLFSSVTLSYPTLCDPMDCSTPGLLSITNSRSLPKLMSIESVMPSNHLIFCHPLLLLPRIFPSIRVFSNESALCIRWPKLLEFQLQHQSFQ